MGFLSLPEDTTDFVLTDEEGQKATFKLKRALSKSDLNHAFMRVIEVSSKLPRRDDTVQVEREPQALTLDMVMGMPDGQLAVLERAIAGWDLTYPKGHPDYPSPVPLNEEMIQSLTSAIVDGLCEEVKRLNRTRGVDEIKDLSNGSSPTSTSATSSLKS